MTYKEKRIFFNWLQKHDALEGYKRNKYVFTQGRALRRRYSYLSMDIIEALSAAFCWGDTPEGSQYWGNLDSKWMNEHRNVLSKHYDTRRETYIF